jgi:hypothetical protein
MIIPVLIERLSRVTPPEHFTYLNLKISIENSAFCKLGDFLLLHRYFLFVGADKVDPVENDSEALQKSREKTL